MTDTETKLIQLATERFNVEDTGFQADTDFFQALGIDSLKALEMLSDLEMEFDVEIPDYELQGVTTFGGLAALIDERL